MLMEVPEPITAPDPFVTVSPVVPELSAPVEIEFCLAFKAACKSVCALRVPVMSPQAEAPPPPPPPVHRVSSCEAVIFFIVSLEVSQIRNKSVLEMPELSSPGSFGGFTVSSACAAVKTRSHKRKVTRFMM
jgi:hypothetical protein